jgi:hypothetical protein
MKMKKLLFIGSFVLATSLFATSQDQEPSNRILKVEEMCGANIEKFPQGQLGDCIVEFSEGARLPLKIEFLGEFLGIESQSPTPLFFKVLKRCYVRCEEKDTFLFSTDLQNWKEFSEFFSGHMNFSIKEDNKTVGAQVELELSQKKS